MGFLIFKSFRIYVESKFVLFGLSFWFLIFYGFYVCFLYGVGFFGLSK